jgi:hypothetical protein
MPNPRPIPFAAALLALVLVVVSCVVMAGRIAGYNAEYGRITYLQFEVTERDFSFAERPVTIADLPADGAHPLGAVRVSYADESLTLPVTIPPIEYSEQFPGMERHHDWLRVARFARLTDRSYDQLVEAMDRREEPDRLVVVTKSPRPGVNTATWGRVWRKDWVFDFYELLPEGGFRHERFAYPTARTAAQQDQRRAAEAESQGGLPELDTRSWQFQLADMLMPEGSAPRIIAGDSPLVATGWTFPTAILSVFAAVAGLLLAFAPPRARREAGSQAPER